MGRSKTSPGTRNNSENSVGLKLGMSPDGVTFNSRDDDSSQALGSSYGKRSSLELRYHSECAK